MKSFNQFKAALEEAKKHTIPKTEKEKDLAALAEPKDKITHADVMVGRGVAKEETEKKSEKQDLPFTPDKPHKPVAKAGKYGSGYSTARHLARQGMKDVQKEEVELDEAGAPGPAHVYDSSNEKRHSTYSSYKKAVDAMKKLNSDEKTSKYEVRSAKLDEEQLDEEGTPTGIKIYHTTKEGKPTHGIVFTPHDARTYEKEVKSSGGKVTHRAVMYGKTEGEKHAVKEGVEIAEETLEELKKSTLGSYIKKASSQAAEAGAAGDALSAGQKAEKNKPEAGSAMYALRRKREAGVQTAMGKLTKEETEMSQMDQYIAAIGDNANFTSVEERKLTAAELKKREEIAQAMEREHPGMDKSKKMAIATAQAKKVAEEVEQIDELKASTLRSYSDKADASFDSAKDDKTKAKRAAGLNAAEKKLERKANSGNPFKEEVELEEAISDADKETMKKRAVMARPELERTKDVTRKFGGGEKGAKNVEQGFRSAIKRDYKKMDEEEQINEISKMTAREYLNKAGKQIDVGIDNKEKREKRIDGYFNASARLADMKPTSWRHKSVKEEVESVEEAMISYGDFMDKIKMHRKMGNKIVDDKYSDKHATYTSIDKEGVGRKVTHTASGQKMENLGKVNGDDDEAAEVKTEKRGRGRPAGTKSGARRHS